MANPTNTSLPSRESTVSETRPPSNIQHPDQDNAIHQSSAEAPSILRTSGSDEPPPPAKPPRPLSPREQAEKTLIEAFPSIDVAVVKAVLTASGGNVEPAFDALLGMTDPDSQKDVPPPAKPPRPAQQSGLPTSTAQSQLEADEMYARQLHEHYSSTGRQQRQNVVPNQQPTRPHTQAQEEREYSFLDDDLPMIRENIRKGFLETQSTVNKWVTNFKKKLDGEDDEGFSNQPAKPAQRLQGSNQGFPNYGRRSSEMARRSADRERYDADPQVLGDDFSTLELRDGDRPPPKKPQRPLANPDLFKPNSPAGSDRKVSFQNGPPEEMDDLYSGSSKPSRQQVPSGKSSKWQPLSAVEPSPVAENDPFSLGDSDDDKDSRVKENRSDEAERLQLSTAESMAGSIGDNPKNASGTEMSQGTKT
ncbi:hypothetical protein EPUS_00791 [Endocarpon pusillum Z07020]|uniref:CUE domain-containing protein n=1 Tax=Endocarpon pusillum (strain Z07020 / HMAS-L-300199) TaxID=1263415 RepID=U1GRR2_ENDPU|nr:uncharacterized protein EPUS_00791 [Endocarpon pusillum Z07020]ERF74661.1 hypothetical protein EPUS_00791 [Endocarpon pusillum Z07020]